MHPRIPCQGWGTTLYTNFPKVGLVRPGHIALTGAYFSLAPGYARTGNLRAPPQISNSVEGRSLNVDSFLWVIR
jgi:hypothetical protein